MLVHSYLNTSKMNICSICFCNEEYTLKCVDHRCESRICEDCFRVYLKHCLDTNNLVRCINEHCKYYIVSGSFSKNCDYLDMYNKVLKNAFMHSQEDEVRHKINVNKMVTNLRSERKTYVKTFPKAVNLVINIALRDKLNNIGEQNKKYIKEVMTGINKLCMNSQCAGKLDKSFKCVLCFTTFCKECEKRKNENHKCKEEDLQSIQMIDMLPKCPKCNIRVEKSEGCNKMTCSNCNTVFNYGSGEKIGSSNREVNNTRILKQQEKFSFDFKQHYDSTIGMLLYNIEIYSVKEPSKQALNNTIQKLINNESMDENEMVKVFEKYINNKLKYIRFIDITIKVEDLHAKGELTANELEELLNLLRDH